MYILLKLVADIKRAFDRCNNTNITPAAGTESVITIPPSDFGFYSGTVVRYKNQGTSTAGPSLPLPTAFLRQVRVLVKCLSD